MSRRAASFTQADAARALRAAQQVGPNWVVEIEGGVIRIVRPLTPLVASVEVPVAVEEVPAEPKWVF